MSALCARGITMRFGGLVAVQDVSFTVQPGQIYAVIGPNGAGKTTLFNAITGIYEPTSGDVTFQDRVVVLPFSWDAALRIALIALACAVSAVFAINIQSLWQVAIVENYLYAQPFPWRKGLSDFAHAVGTLSFSTGVLTAILGAVGGGGAAAVLWWRSRRTPDLIARSGVARTFQNIRLFNELSLVQNVLVGMDHRMRAGVWSALFRLPRFQRERKEFYAEAMELLNFVGLADRVDDAAGNLPYGFRRRLEIARALAGRPRLILLDEPAAGMNPSEIVGLMALIRRVRDAGTTVILIEHHMRLVMGVSDRILVLQYGRQIAEGTPAEIRANPACIEAYLGTESHG